GNVLSQSGSFWWKPESDSEYEWLTRQLVASPRLPIRFYLEVGLLENINPAREDSPTNLVANRHLRDVLQARGYSVRFQEVSGGHDYFPWQSTFADGVLALIGEGKFQSKAVSLRRHTTNSRRNPQPRNHESIKSP